MTFILQPDVSVLKSWLRKNMLYKLYKIANFESFWFILTLRQLSWQERFRHRTEHETPTPQWNALEHWNYTGSDSEGVQPNNLRVILRPTDRDLLMSSWCHPKLNASMGFDAKGQSRNMKQLEAAWSSLKQLEAAWSSLKQPREDAAAPCPTMGPSSGGPCRGFRSWIEAAMSQRLRRVWHVHVDKDVDLVTSWKCCAINICPDENCFDKLVAVFGLKKSQNKLSLKITVMTEWFCRNSH